MPTWNELFLDDKNIAVMPQPEIYKFSKKVEGIFPGESLRFWDFCCGAGSGVRAAYPEYSKWVCKERLDEVKEVGASVLASACPFCKNNFVETLKDFPDLKIDVVDISELLEEAL